MGKSGNGDGSLKEEEKEKSVPGFSIILLLSSLAAAGILDRRKMDGNL